MIKALKRKQMVEGLITHRNVFREMKKQNLQTEITMYFHKDTLSVPTSPASPSTSSTLPSLPFIKVNPLLFLLLFSLLSKKVSGMKTFMIIHFQSMSSK
jgi:hypothetical protein